jgi:hypothetical protein
MDLSDALVDEIVRNPCVVRRLENAALPPIAKLERRHCQLRLEFASLVATASNEAGSQPRASV